MARPVGVTILAVLAIIGGILALCGGGALLLGGTALSGALASSGATSGLASSGMLAGLGALTLVLGVLDIVLGVGMLMLKPWAWLLGVVLEVINLIEAGAMVALKVSNIGTQIIGIVVSLIILFYLFRPNVRAAFGRA
ncbi:MAG TPA: hypothetical protein VID73_06535 [Ktedonobacterales bacterium]|jgi:hypothetical protein